MGFAKPKQPPTERLPQGTLIVKQAIRNPLEPSAALQPGEVFTNEMVQATGYKQSCSLVRRNLLVVQVETLAEAEDVVKNSVPAPSDISNEENQESTNESGQTELSLGDSTSDLDSFNEDEESVTE